MPKVRLPASARVTETALVQDSSTQGFFRLRTQPPYFLAADGAETLGFGSSFGDEIDAMGSYTQTEFAR